MYVAWVYRRVVFYDPAMYLELVWSNDDLELRYRHFYPCGNYFHLVYCECQNVEKIQKEQCITDI